MTCRIGDGYKYIVLGVVQFFAVGVVVGMVQVVMVVQVVGEAVQNSKAHQGQKAAGASCSNFYSNCPKKFGFP